MRTHEQQPGQLGGGRAAGAAGPSPGKRTLTDELGAGEGLPPVQRAQFEQSLGRDLSGVRVHTNEAAAERADRADARAFATGQDIVVGRGEQGGDKWMS